MYLKFCRFGAFLTLILLASGCNQDRAPSGFQAVSPTRVEPYKTGCPNLSGRYDLAEAYAKSSLVTDLLGHQNPAMKTLIVDELTGSNTYNFRLQMDMAEFLAQANALRNKNPADYYEWRKLTIELLNGSLATISSQKVKAALELGPVLQVKGHARAYSCEDGWMKVLERERNVESEEGRFTRQWDLWLGRDADGNLLLKTITYRQKAGWTFWAAGGAGVRLIREGTLWDKVRAASTVADEQVLREQDLPAIAPPNRSADCRRDVGYLVAYNQQLMTQLPDGTELTTFLPIEGRATDPCDRQKLQVGFRSFQPGASEAILRNLKQDPRVEDLVLKQSELGPNRQRQILVEFVLVLE